MTKLRIPLMTNREIETPTATVSIQFLLNVRELLAALDFCGDSKIGQLISSTSEELENTLNNYKGM